MTVRLTIKARADLPRTLAVKNISTAWLATQIKCNIHHLSRIIHGHVCPTAKLRARICEALGMPFEEVFAIQEQPK